MFKVQYTAVKSLTNDKQLQLSSKTNRQSVWLHQKTAFSAKVVGDFDLQTMNLKMSCLWTW